MPVWVEVALWVALLVLVAALVVAALELRRLLRRAEAVLAIVEQALGPLLAEARGLTGDARDLTREARAQLERIGAVARRATEVAEGMGRVVGMIGSLTRAGQVVALASGLRRGLGVFIHRMKRDRGAHHGE